ncbi:hypothetical protein CCR75_004200 [Bremia lactucae]|uniref:Uncharacterized protein n=1 Tax=Bremia lactucae TaxID=4779 RepID=A0A976FK68_BRELC|nr:hypothetical protein CCR75_004200 [Bremia lactucae]
MSGYKILQKAFEKAKYHKGVTSMTVDQVCDQILESYPKSELELGGKEHLRSFVSSYLQEDTAAFDRVEDATSLVPAYKMKPLLAASDIKKSVSINPVLKPEENGTSGQKKQKITA